MAMAVATAVTLSYRRSRTASRDYSTTSSLTSNAEKGSSLITLNIGGKRFETFENTLNQFPNTLLGNAEKRRKYFDEKKDEYFFDRHRSAFTAILYYYQSGGLIERPLHVPIDIFMEELNFFQLTDEIQKENEEAAYTEDVEEGTDQASEEEELPQNKLLRSIWLLFEYPSSSLHAKCLAVFSLIIILLSIVIFCIETVPALHNVTHVFFVMNAVCSSWFTFEYLIRLIASPNKLKFLKAILNILDLLSILPFYVTVSLSTESAGTIGILRVMRVIRVCRIFKLTRHSKGLHILGNTLSASVNELIMLMLFLVIGVVLFASAAYYAEGEENGSKFKSIPAAFWWAVVTMTTVGYGDMYPVTTVGKLVGALCALSGVLAIALPVPVIVSNFEYYYKLELNKREDAKNASAVTYQNLDNLVLKSPLLERKVLMESDQAVSPLSVHTHKNLDFSTGVYANTAGHRNANGSMKFSGPEAIIEADELSFSSGGGSKPSTPKVRGKQHHLYPTSETTL
ncbi:potassium voltage-gated channel subfamily A member 1-like [Acropora muricata]|uniref:potassium voltage-gated channel subfamily A member 1-like n=1 Tax=Acropora muricata TaxID=159855 RepID=UPI0034E5BB47